MDTESSSLTYTGKDTEILAYNTPGYDVFLGGTSSIVTSPRDTTNFFTFVQQVSLRAEAPLERYGAVPRR